MKYLQFTQYICLVFAAVFRYDGITKLNDNEKPWLSFMIAGVSVFMFFFRRKFSKKFQDRQK